MADTFAPGSAAKASEREALQAEIVRLNKIVKALMDRAERGAGLGNSDFALLQTSVMLEDEVRRRTEELSAALQENERITRDLRESEGRFRALADQSMVGIGIIEDGHFTYVNPKMTEVFGYPADVMLTMSPLDTVHPADRPRVGANIEAAFARGGSTRPIEFRGLKSDGSAPQIEVTSTLMDVGDRMSLVSLVTDITARKQAESEVRILQARLQQQAIHDPLTGLFNRRFLDENFEREIARAQRHGHQIGVVLGDIDFFKAANDEHGHLAGDEILRTLGGLLKLSSRRSDTGYRYGGEEFLLVMPEVSKPTALARAEELRAKIDRAEIPFESNHLSVTMSFGVAIYPDDGLTADELVSAADAAMYRAKAAGRNRVMLAEQT